MNQFEYKSELERLKAEEKLWNQEKKILERRRALEEDKKKYRRRSFKIKISTTKLIVLFIFLNCTVIEIYSMWAMIVLQDLSALGSLIASVVGETISFAIYCYKSTKENTQGGIIYEKMRYDNEYNRNQSSDSDDSNNGVG